MSLDDDLTARLVDPYDQHWMDQAACEGADPLTFFPERGGDVRATVNAAKAICATCPVVSPCLEYALANKERWGVWGGLGEHERRRLKRARLRLGRSA